MAYSDFKINVSEIYYIDQLEEEGMQLQINGEHIALRGAIATISGDNLSSHALGGFRCCFSSGKVCRHRLITYNDLPKIHTESECVMRKSTDHAAHVRVSLTARS